MKYIFLDYRFHQIAMPSAGKNSGEKVARNANTITKAATPPVTAKAFARISLISPKKYH